MTATEYVVLVNKENKVTGSEEKLTAHAKNLLHRAFSVFIFRRQTDQSEIELLLQQRAFDKYHSQGLWTNTCCSHPRANEPIITAGERRLTEEIGIKTKLQDLGWFHYNAHFENGLSENEIDHVLVGTVPFETVIAPNPQEVHACRWVSPTDLEAEMVNEPKKFTPWFAQAYDIVKPFLSRL